MASDLSFVQYVTEQIDSEHEISYRKMFGEYAVYCNQKVVALVCDNQLFIKPTVAGREFIGEVVEVPAYPGAKPSFLIEAQIDDREWLSRLIAITEAELPAPKPKKKRKSKTSKDRSK